MKWAKKSIHKGEFAVMKTGTNPMRTRVCGCFESEDLFRRALLDHRVRDEYYDVYKELGQLGLIGYSKKRILQQASL